MKTYSVDFETSGYSGEMTRWHEEYETVGLSRVRVKKQGRQHYAGTELQEVQRFRATSTLPFIVVIKHEYYGEPNCLGNFKLLRSEIRIYNSKNVKYPQAIKSAA